MPITPTSRKPTNRAKAARLYELIIDAVQDFALPELMAMKNGASWESLSPQMREVFEDIAAKL